MKNKEFYKDQIFELACNCETIALNKKTHKIGPCHKVECDNCEFYSGSQLCEYTFKVWLKQEHTEPILDSVEKRYLENIIRPFRRRVKSITKRLYSNDHEYIELDIKSIWDRKYELMNLPLFLRNKMYRSMETEKEYTLKDLGLFENE